MQHLDLCCVFYLFKEQVRKKQTWITHLCIQEGHSAMASPIKLEKKFILVLNRKFDVQRVGVIRVMAPPANRGKNYLALNRKLEA